MLKCEEPSEDPGLYPQPILLITGEILPQNQSKSHTLHPDLWGACQRTPFYVILLNLGNGFRVSAGLMFLVGTELMACERQGGLRESVPGLSIASPLIVAHKSSSPPLALPFPGPARWLDSQAGLSREPRANPGGLPELTSHSRGLQF